MLNHLTVQIKPHIFDHLKTVLIIGFLCIFKLAYDTSGIHTGSAMWLYHFFTKTSTSSALYIRLASILMTRMRVISTRKSTMHTKYRQVLYYVLQTYATIENIADTKNEMTKSIQPPNQTLSQYAKKFVTKTFCLADAYEEEALNKIFIMELDMFIKQSMKGYWSPRKMVSLQDLAFHAGHS